MAPIITIGTIAISKAAATKASMSSGRKLLLVLRRNFLQKAGWIINSGLTINCTHGGVGQKQLTLCAGYAHIAGATLLLQLLWAVQGSGMREHAFLHSGNKYYRELQALGCMKCHHCNPVSGLNGIIKISNQGNMLKEIKEAGFGFRLFKILGHTHKFPNIFYAGGILLSLLLIRL